MPLADDDQVRLPAQDSTGDREPGALGREHQASRALRSLTRSLLHGFVDRSPGLLGQSLRGIPGGIAVIVSVAPGRVNKQQLGSLLARKPGRLAQGIQAPGGHLRTTGMELHPHEDLADVDHGRWSPQRTRAAALSPAAAISRARSSYPSRPMSA